MNTLDKYIARQFGINYLISFAVLVSIYIILDLFFNFDEFTQATNLSMIQIVVAIVKYYGIHLFLYFSQISGVITLFAMAFTLARLQRDNEFVAVVSSGVSLYRIALTVIVLGVALNGLWLIDQELIVPRLAPQLARPHKAAALDQPSGVWFLRDRFGALLSASRFDRRTSSLGDVLLIRRGPGSDPGDIIMADRAEWVGRSEDGLGTWKLERGRRLYLHIDDDGQYEKLSEAKDSLTTDLGPEDIALRQSAKWMHFLSRSQLAQLRDQGGAQTARIASTLHNRFATPLVNMLILIIGVPIFLDRQPGKVIQSGGRCLLICGACFLFAFFVQNITSSSLPALTAWLPLIVLTPVMVISLDRMKT